MSRPNRSNHAVSLFPFLAVLVCAMGALIFLLVVTTRRIRSEAMARAAHAVEEAAACHGRLDRPVPPPGHTRSMLPVAAVPVETGETPDPEPPAKPRAEEPPVEAPRPPPPDPNVALRKRIARLTAERDRLREAIAQSAASRDAAAGQLDEQRRRLAGLEQQLNDVVAQQQLNARNAELLAGQRAEIAERIDQVEGQLARARRQTATESSKYQIVPFDGASGTIRRPILIEFTGDGIRFQPEGIVLRQEDFVGFTMGYNPLLAGAQALVNYWQVQDRLAGRDSAAYVLMIVRPSGVRYYPARQLLSRLGEDSGYELLQEDQELALPEVDPEAAEACRRAVQRMLDERDALVRMVLAGRGGSAAAGLARGLHDFDVSRLFDDDAARSARETAQASPGRQASEAAHGSHRPLAGAAGTPPGERSGPVFRGHRRPAYELTETNDGIVLPPGSRRPRIVHIPTGQPRITGDSTGRVTEFPSRHDSPTAHGGMTTRDGAAPAEPARLDARETGSAYGGLLNGGQRPGGEGWQPFDDQPPPLVGEIQRRTVGSGGSILDTGEATRVGTDGSAQTKGDRDAPGELSNTSPPRTASLAGIDDADLSAATQGGHRGDHAAAGSLSGRGASGSADADSRSPGRGSAATGSDGAGSSGRLGEAPPAGLPVVTLPDLYSPRIRPHAPSSLQTARGRRWGQSSPRASIGFERQIDITAQAERLVIEGETVIEAGQGETRDELLARVLSAVETTARSWSAPPENFYWAPTLRFRVAPGGNQHYARLQRGLDEWGLPSRATQELEVAAERDTSRESTSER